MAQEWLDSMLNPQISKEANVTPQGENAVDHFEKKLEANAWVEGLMGLDEQKIEADYLAAQAAEARALGKTAAHEFKSDEEVLKADKERATKALSDYALAEMLAELRCSKEQNTQEMFHIEKERAKKEVASSREKAEKALMDMIPENTHLDWQKAFERFSKEATPEQATEKDLFQPKAPEKEHEFQKPTEEKFKVPSDDKKADVMIGVGREADERTEATKEAGVLQESITEGLGKVASTIKKAEVTPSGLKNKLMEMGYSEESANAISGQWQAGQTVGTEPKTKLDVDRALAELSKSSAMNPLKREELHTEADMCPVCGSMGKDTGNGQMDHMACAGCGISYASKTAGAHEAWDVFLNGKEIDTIFYTADPNRTAEDVKRDLVNHDGYDANIIVKKGSQEITSYASKEDVIKIIKQAEIQSPWQIVLDENGQECIARVSQPTNEKVSEENKDEEIQK